MIRIELTSIGGLCFVITRYPSGRTVIAAIN